jgi:DHA2 family multidrug resistance protein-like MFS transporter
MTPLPGRWAVLASASAGLLLITLDNSILYTALPTLSRELSATQSEALWIINAYPLVMAGLLLGAGTLGDRVGHRRMFLWGLFLFGLASLGAAFAPSAPALIAARAILAVGASAMMPATLALIRVSFEDERERTLAIALWGSLSVVGSAIGPIVGGLLLERFWWGSVFLINVPVVILAFAGAWLVAPKIAPDLSRTWDAISSLLALVALTGMVFAIKQGIKFEGWLVPVAALATAAVAGRLFVRRQFRLVYPLLDFALFRNKAFFAGVLSAAFTLFAIGGLALVTTQRFQLVAGYSPMEAGLLVSAVALGSLPTALLGGAMLHRLGLSILISGGLMAGAIAVAFTTVAVHMDLGLGWTIFGLVMTGSGVGAAISVASTAIIGNAPVHRAGMAASVEEVSYEFGGLLAVALLGTLMSAVYSFGGAFPASTPDRARESLAAALDIAAAEGGEVLRAAAVAAFERSFVVVMALVALILAIGSVVTGLLLRDHGPGTQSSVAAAH